MPKMRIYELAKELNRPSKDIIPLVNNGDAGINHMSTIDEEAVERIRSHFAPKAEKPAEPAKAPAEAPKAAAPEKADAAPAEAKPEEAKKPAEGEKPKKKNITMIFNPQNTRTGGGRNQKNGPRNGQGGRDSRDRNRNQGGGNNRGQQNPQGRGNAQKPQGDRPRQDRNRTGQQSNAYAARGPKVQLRPNTSVNRPNAPLSEQPKRPEPAPVKPEPIAEEPVVETAAAVQAAQTEAPVVEVPAAEPTKTPEKDTRKSGERNEKAGNKERSVSKSGKNNRNNSDNRPGNRYGDKNSQGGKKEQRGVEQNTGRHSGKRDNAQPAAAAEPAKDRNDRSKGKKQHQTYNKKDAPKQQERYVNLEKKTGHKKRNAAPQAPEAKKSRDEITTITLPEYLTVRDLADRMKVNPSEIIKKLFLSGQILTLNQEIDYERAEAIALEFNCIAEPEEKVDVIEELLKDEEDDEATLVTRPPVVCVMGHVDHGKTSLLDAIRETHVTEREAGGITQHIGASVAEINGRKITFLDTPGHEAFTAMRMRGANSTDIAILVVAADDGIMPQTIEAINHAKAAGIEIIVAINKIDKPGANVDFVLKGLADQGLIPEDWGGSTICVPVSAKTHEGIDQLLEMVLLSADILELKANPKRKARGLVIEAKIDKGRGTVATVLIQKGTLKVGEPVAAGSSYGKVRAMTDHNGKRVKEAGPSTPVEIIGLNSVPGAGEVLMAFDSEKDARSFAETFVSQDKEKLLDETRARRNLDDIFSQIQAGDLKELDLIVKADVQGSVEAVKTSLEKLSNEEVVVKVIHSAAGAISESDVSLASASNAIIIGFNVNLDPNAKNIADQEKVDIRTYNVIYQAIDDVENAMKGMLEPIYEERVIGHAEVRQLFKASGVGTIAGSYVQDGTFERNCKIRIFRNDDKIYEGSLASLKRFKDDVKEVRAGYECGLVFDGFNEIQEGDQVEAFKMVEVPRT